MIGLWEMIEMFESWPGIHQGSSGLCLSHPQLSSRTNEPCIEPGLVGAYWLSQAISSKWFQSACWFLPKAPPKHSAQPRIGGWLTDWVLFRWIQWTLCTSWCNPRPRQQPFGCRWAGGMQNLDGYWQWASNSPQLSVSLAGNMMIIPLGLDLKMLG